MKPARFDYIAPKTLAAAVDALAASNGEGKLLAGGQSLLPLLNFRMARPSVLVDLNGIKELWFIERRGDSVVIGALTRHCQIELSPLIASELPVMSAAMRHVAHLAIRNRGTIGGSLSHADPAAELPMMAMLLDAGLRVASALGTRTVAAHDFFKNALSVDLAEDEIVTEIVLPKLPPRTGWGFAEVARRHGDFALAAAAATLSIAADSITEVRIALTGIGRTALRVAAAEKLIVGQTLRADVSNQVVEAVRAAIEPDTDLHASADYRRHLAGVLTRRALAAAWRRARESVA